MELNDQLFEFDSEERKFKTKVLTQGLLNSYQNKIEMWYAGKKVHKTIIAEIISGGLLFPLFKTQLKSSRKESRMGEIFLEQHELGLGACYELMLEGFEPSELTFEIILEYDS